MRRLSIVLLALIVLVYLGIAWLYATKTPAWQVPDEPAHYNYVAQLATIHSIPTIQPGDWNNNYLEQLKASRFNPSLAPYCWSAYPRIVSSNAPKVVALSKNCSSKPRTSTSWHASAGSTRSRSGAPTWPPTAASRSSVNGCDHRSARESWTRSRRSGFFSPGSGSAKPTGAMVTPCG